MAPLSPEDKALLKEALDVRLHKEELERALGRVLRRKGIDFDRYVSIMGEVREEARKRGKDIEGAARDLIGQS